MKQSLFNRIANKASRIGEKYNIEFLVYNPGIFIEFDQIAKINAPLFTSALVRAFPQCLSFVDVGCGTGRFSSELMKLGKTVTAFEYAFSGRVFSRLRGVQAVPFDVAKSAEPRLSRKHDVAFSLEVAEHLPPTLSLDFVKYTTACADLVVFSAAAVGQGGRGHINCRDKSEWEAFFLECRFKRDIDKESVLRRELDACVNLSFYLKNNPMVFVRSV